MAPVCHADLAIFFIGIPLVFMGLAAWGEVQLWLGISITLILVVGYWSERYICRNLVD